MMKFALFLIFMILGALIGFLGSDGFVLEDKVAITILGLLFGCFAGALMRFTLHPKNKEDDFPYSAM